MACFFFLTRSQLGEIKGISLCLWPVFSETDENKLTIENNSWTLQYNQPEIEPI